MPKYRVYMDYGFAGCNEEEIIECEDEEEAENYGFDQISQNISVMVEEIEEDEDE